MTVDGFLGAVIDASLAHDFRSSADNPRAEWNPAPSGRQPRAFAASLAEGGSLQDPAGYVERLNRLLLELL